MRSSFQTLLLLTLTLCFAACSGAAEVVEIPTLAVLPVTPSATPIPSPTDTPTVTATPSATPRPPCDWAGYWATVEPSVVEFLDTSQIAVSTSRAALAPLLLELQRTWRAFQRLSIETCAASVHDQLGYAMEISIEGFNDFLAEYEEVANVAFTVSNQYFFNAATVLYNEATVIDPRLTATFDIWGGEPPSYEFATSPPLFEEALIAEVTRSAQEVADLEATVVWLRASATAMFGN